MNEYQKYYWAIEQQPVSTLYPFELPHPNDLFIHLTWEQRQGIGVHSLYTQHRLHVARSGHSDDITDKALQGMSSNILNDMAECGIFKQPGFADYQLCSAAITRPEVMREHQYGAVSCINWQDICGGSVHVETFHDLHRKAKEAPYALNQYGHGTIDMLYRNDKWHISMQRERFDDTCRRQPQVDSTYRNMYTLHSGISAGKDAIGLRVGGDSERTYTFSTAHPLVFNTPKSNKLWTQATVDNFDECWLYAMALGEGHAQFYLTDIAQFADIDPEMRRGVRDVLYANANAGFAVERVEFVRIVYQDGEPTVLLESGLLVNL